MHDLLSIFAAGNRTRLLFIAGFMIVAIAVLDWATKPYFSIGFLYLFPIIILGGFLSRVKIVGVALVCAVLQEAFSNLPINEAFIRLIFSSAGLIGTGLLVSEFLRNRRIVIEHFEELQSEVQLRQDVEQELQILVESSPAAIITIDRNGVVLLANQAARELLAPDATTLIGSTIGSFLPSLHAVVASEPSRSFRTTLQCKGIRSTGEAFLAGIWFSTYSTLAGPRLAAVIVDLSDDLRDREELSLNYLLRSSKILVSALAHEVRSLCGAALVVQKNLSEMVELQGNEDFLALKTLIESLERISAVGIQSVPVKTASSVELTSVLDELRVLIEGSYHEAGIDIHWDLAEPLPLVKADRYGLIQVFLNLANNSRRAMEVTSVKNLTISPTVEGNTVVVRFQDTGTGVAVPADLFRPFQPGAQSTGLGLYVSRAIMRTFDGELLFQPTSQGCCFAVVMPTALTADGAKRV